MDYKFSNLASSLSNPQTCSFFNLNQLKHNHKSVILTFFSFAPSSLPSAPQILSQISHQVLGGYFYDLISEGNPLLPLSAAPNQAGPVLVYRDLALSWHISKIQMERPICSSERKIPTPCPSACGKIILSMRHSRTFVIFPNLTLKTLF